METKADVHAGKVFHRTLKAFNSGKKVIIHKGGTGSGKTYDIMLFLMLYVLPIKPNQVITVVSESKPHLDIGVIRIMKNVLKQAGAWRDADFNISTSRYTFHNGSIIEFFSADRIDKALGARRDWLFGNEINSLKLDVWDELARRSEYVMGDFNPTSQFWLEDWVENYDDVQVITSNYMDNKFLPDTEKQRIVKRAGRDTNFKRIHIDCEYGVYEGLVFEDFLQVDELPQGKEYAGLDFGYTADPSALVKVVETGNGWYVDELFYQTGMLSTDIAKRMRSLVGGQLVKADSADPRLIDELKLSGLNVKAAEKGPDSIIAGIDKLKTKKLYVTKRSVNLIRELRNYAWEVDKNGRATNKPIDAFNHGIDAMRYAIMGKGMTAMEPDKLEGIFY